MTIQQQADAILARAERARLIGRAAVLRVDIEQIFTDCASWNDNSTARKEGCDSIDCDPDGQLRRMADGLDRMLAAEQARIDGDAK